MVDTNVLVFMNGIKVGYWICLIVVAIIAGWTIATIYEMKLKKYERFLRQTSQLDKYQQWQRKWQQKKKELYD